MHRPYSLDELSSSDDEDSSELEVSSSKELEYDSNLLELLDSSEDELNWLEEDFIEL